MPNSFDFFLLLFLDGRTEGLGSAMDEPKKGLFSVLAGVSNVESEQRRCLFPAFGADALRFHPSDIARLGGGTGAVLGTDSWCDWDCGAGIADQLVLRCCPIRFCWLGDGVNILGSSSANGVRLGLKKESMGFDCFPSGV